MSPAWKAVFPLLALLAAAPPAAAIAPRPSSAQIARWVKQLGDNQFGVRQEASRHLWEAGATAEEALTRAARSTDPEVRRRANDLLDKFRWGIYPDTPRDLVALVERYQAGSTDVKQAALRQLLDRGSRGCAVAARVLTAEPSTEVRRVLLLVVAQDSPRAYAPLLEAGDFATVEKLLEATLAVPLNETAVQNYAAYCLLHGRIDDRLRHFRAKAEAGHDPAAYVLLTYLERARGDLGAARTAAEKSSRQDLLDQVLTEQGEWKALAQRADDRAKPNDLRNLGFRLAYHRLAGDAAGLDRAVAALHTQVGPRSEDAVKWLLARDLLLNDRPGDALALLQGFRPSVVFELLVARLQLREALALDGRAAADDPAEQVALEVAQARTRYLLGDRDGARAVFARIGTGTGQGREGRSYDLLVKTEARLGLKEDALRHCARFLTGPQGTGREEALLGLLFPKQGSRAAAWWQILRQHPGADPVAALKQVRDLVEGRTDGKKLEALAGEAVRAAQRQEGEVREKWLLAVADTCQEAGLDGAARDFLERAAEAGSPVALVHLGDFLAGKKQWAEAADLYGRAWRKDHKDPLPLFLQGWSLTQGGHEREGARLTELAHWVPLGDETVRQQFATDLRRRGHADAARRERQLLLAVCTPGSFPAGEALRDASLEDMDRGEYLKAAGEQDRSLLRLLEPDVEFVDRSAYVLVPAFNHRLRALGLAAAGRADGAVRETETALELLPGSVELTTRLVPVLERLGRKKEANRFFGRSADVQRRLCAEYPRSAWLHNNAAWLSAVCRRDLDAGLEHALHAVALDPATTGYKDTLAEVRFQRGEQDQAVRLMRECLARDPKNVYYQKQLKRFEAGDRSAALPDH